MIKNHKLTQSITNVLWSEFMKIIIGDDGNEKSIKKNF